MAEFEISVSTDDIVARSTDSKGRITLGVEHADKDVEVAILEVSEEEPAETEQRAEETAA